MGFLSLESGFESFVKLCLNDKLQGRLKNILSDGLVVWVDGLHQYNKGDIKIELDFDKAPVTAKNFEQYVKDGFYDA